MEAHQDGHLLEASKFASEQEAGFTTADPNAMLQPQPRDLAARGNAAFPQAGRALWGRQAHVIHSLSACSPSRMTELRAGV